MKERERDSVNVGNLRGHLKDWVGWRGGVSVASVVMMVVFMGWGAGLGPALSEGALAAEGALTAGALAAEGALTAILWQLALSRRCISSR